MGAKGIYGQAQGLERGHQSARYPAATLGNGTGRDLDDW